MNEVIQFAFWKEATEDIGLITEYSSTRLSICISYSAYYFGTRSILCTAASYEIYKTSY